MKLITFNDLDKLAYGSAILGSGGGGNPVYDVQIVRHQIELYGPVQLLSVEELCADDFVVPIGMMGAPLIMVEKLPSGREFDAIIRNLMPQIGGRRLVLMPVEVGGANAFAPFTIAGKLGVPVLDADLIGRAFPQLQMTAGHLAQVPASPAYFADSFGRTVVIHAHDLMGVEHLGRSVTVAMGSSAALAAYTMDGATAKKVVIPRTITQSLELGEVGLQAIQEGCDPVEAIVKATQGVLLGSGILSDIQQEVNKGFLEGSFTLQVEEGTFDVAYQNEYLVARRGEQVLVSTPDIIMALEQDTGTPISSESLQYGLRVHLIGIPGPELWKSEAGLKVVGPRFFGYPFDYKPLNTRNVNE